MSGLEVLGVIANILDLINFSVEVYERAKSLGDDVNNLPRAFQNVNVVLPSIKNALQETEKRLTEDGMNEEASKNLGNVLLNCRATVSELNDIFCKLLPGEDASKWKRGWNALSSVTYDKKVAALEKSLMQFVDILTLHHVLRNLTVGVGVGESVKETQFLVPSRYEKAKYFIGCESIMFEISKRFAQGESRVAISGIGGIGKSRIAIEYCYQYRDQNPDSNVFWVYGGSRSRLVTAYYEIAEKIKIPEFDKPAVNILTLVSDWLSKAKNGPWLMILDNADDADIWVESSDGPLIDYLPRGEHGLMLITTRNAQLGMAFSDFTQKPINVPILDLDNSVALLRGRVTGDDTLTIEDSREITSILGYLPLAITQAAAYLHRNDMSVAEYLSLLKASKSDVTDLLLRKIPDQSRDPEIQNSVFHTWKISFDQISRQHPRSATILSTMALLDRQAITVDLLREKEEGDLDYRDAMQILKAFSLVTEEVKDKLFSIHRIVQLSIRWYLKCQNTLETWQGRALSCVESNLPDDFDIRSYEALLPHSQLVLSYTYSTEVYKIQRAKLLTYFADYYSHLGQFSLAIQQNSEALTIRESIFGPEHEDTIDTMIDLA